LLALDHRGVLLFAPLEGEAFRELVPEIERGALPDSLVLRTADGRLLVRSAAVLASLRLVGGPGRWLSAAAAVVPGPVADRLYDLVARVRRRLLRPPASTCPAVPPARRGRFLP
jgi:predicted DCC family thiol-disulfide oxidoreductase YuxK